MDRVLRTTEILSDRKTTNNGKEAAETTEIGLFWECSTQANNPEEPGAVIPHAGVCEGAVGQLAVLPRSPIKNTLGTYARCDTRFLSVSQKNIDYFRQNN